jgi:hypothetical protein
MYVILTCEPDGGLPAIPGAAEVYDTLDEAREVAAELERLAAEDDDDVTFPVYRLVPVDGRGDAHVYLSTACFHGEHGYCDAMTGQQGAKRPATCKFCPARCVCPCHAESGQGETTMRVGFDFARSLRDPRLREFLRTVGAARTHIVAATAETTVAEVLCRVEVNGVPSPFLIVMPDEQAAFGFRFLIGDVPQVSPGPAPGASPTTATT